MAKRGRGWERAACQRGEHRRAWGPHRWRAAQDGQGTLSWALTCWRAMPWLVIGMSHLGVFKLNEAGQPWILISEIHWSPGVNKSFLDDFDVCSR